MRIRKLFLWQIFKFSNFQIFSFALFIVSNLIFSSCNSNKTEVTGNILGYANDTIFLEKLLPKMIDKKDLQLKYKSLTGPEGNFEFSFETDETAFYNLRLKNKQTLVLLISPNDVLTINGPKDSLSSKYSVEGSEDCILIQELNQHQFELENVLKSYQNFRKNIHAQLQADSTKSSKDSLIKLQLIEEKKIRDKYTAHKQYIRGFINEHSQSLSSVIASARLDQNEDYEYLKKIDSSLSSHYPNSAYLDDLHKKVEALKVFAIGATPPDIVSYDPSGKLISLYSLRGKLTLIHFWASLSKQARIENQALSNLYQKYNQDGFEIFSVSFDMKKEDWINAIRKDSLIWPCHVCDLKGLGSTIAKDYKIKNVPYNMLLSSDGKILAKGLNNTELENIIKEP
jgi:hypothetical protein